MSIYDCRDHPAYQAMRLEPAFADNVHILRWWASAYDQLLRQCICEWQWYWYWHIGEAVIAITDPAVLSQWQAEDPACKRHNWRNALMYFSIARADELGLGSEVREAKWKCCPLCGQSFLENSLPEPLARRFGVPGLDFCSPCLSKRVLQNTGDNSLSKEEVLSYLRDLSSLLQVVPHQGFGEGIDDFLHLSYSERLAVLRLLGKKPTTSHVKRLYKSWLQALIAAELLEDGTRKTSRGTACIAKDGHVCLSLAEKTIDDFLFAHKIAHRREPHYPNSNMRADFLVKGVYIEYFGLAGNPEYDEKIIAKQELAKLAGLRLVAIYPKDVISLSWLKKTLLTIQ